MKSKSFNPPPPPVKPVEGERAAPALENLETAPPTLANQALPEPSIARARAYPNPPPVYPVEGESAIPALESLDTLKFPEFPAFASQASPEPSIAMARGLSSPPPVYPVGGERAAPTLENLETLLLLRFAIQTSPEPSIAMDWAETSPPPVKVRPRVKSLGWAVRPLANAGLEVERAYKAAMFVPGLCAMLIAAVAVSVGAVPVERLQLTGG
jgi:hypothetical protein